MVDRNFSCSRFFDFSALTIANKHQKYILSSLNEAEYNIPLRPALTIYMTHGGEMPIKMAAACVEKAQIKKRKEENPLLIPEAQLVIKFDINTQRYTIIKSNILVQYPISLLMSEELLLEKPLPKKSYFFWKKAFCYQNRVACDVPLESHVASEMPLAQAMSVVLTETELLSLFDRIVARKNPIIDKNQIRFICDANLGESGGDHVTPLYRKLRTHFNASINIPYTDTPVCQDNAALEFGCVVPNRGGLNKVIWQAFGLNIDPVAPANQPISAPALG